MPNRKQTWKFKVRPVLYFEDRCEVTLSDGSIAILDVSDGPAVEGWNWSAKVSKSGGVYGMRKAGGANVYLHEVVLKVAPGLLPDHRDGNTLNCRRSNLRIATQGGNCQNRRMGSANRSGFKGVCFRKDRGTYLASITVDGKRRKIGTFKTALEAARAYDEMAAKLFGEFGRLNFPRK